MRLLLMKTHTSIIWVLHPVLPAELPSSLSKIFFLLIENAPEAMSLPAKLDGEGVMKKKKGVKHASARSDGKCGLRMYSLSLLLTDSIIAHTGTSTLLPTIVAIATCYSPRAKPTACYTQSDGPY